MARYSHLSCINYEVRVLSIRILSKIKQEFLIYSFLGWVLENCYNKLINGTFIKPNFLHGPVKPMYGFGGMLLAESYRLYPKGFGYASVVIPLLVEWCSGKWLDCRYHLKYWDYSKEHIQLGGYICLKFAICWVLLAQIVIRMIQPAVDKWLAFTGRLPMWKTMFRSFLLDCTVTIYQREKRIHQA